MAEKKLSARLKRLKKIKKIDCRRNEENRIRNKGNKTRWNNAHKKFIAKVAMNRAGQCSKEDLVLGYSEFNRATSIAVNKKVIHANKQARLLSNLYKLAFGIPAAHANI